MISPAHIKSGESHFGLHRRRQNRLWRWTAYYEEIRMAARRFLTLTGTAMMAAGLHGQRFSDYNGKQVVLAATKEDDTYALNYAVGTGSNAGRIKKIPVTLNDENKIVWLTTETEQQKILWTVDGSQSNVTLKSVYDNQYLTLTTTPTLKKEETSSTSNKWAFSEAYRSVTFEKKGILMQPTCFRLDFTNYITNQTYLYPIAQFHFLAPHVWRTLDNSDFGTICLPRAVRADEVAGATFYEIAAKVVDEEEMFLGVVLQEVTGDLAAGTPYIYKRAGEATYIVAAMHGDVAEVPVANEGLVGVLNVAGTDNGFPVPAGKYILQADQLWETTAYFDREKGVTVSRSRLQAGHAYIDPDDIATTINEEEAKRVEGLLLGLDGAFAHVTAPKADTSSLDNLPSETYDVTGRKVPNLKTRRNILIRNGKKRIIR